MQPPVQQRARLRSLAAAHECDEQRVLEHLPLRAAAADAHDLVRLRLEDASASRVILFGEGRHGRADL